MTQCVAVILGIEVGRAIRIAMAELRKMAEGLGPDRVRTQCNSGAGDNDHSFTATGGVLWLSRAIGGSYDPPLQGTLPG